MASVNSVNSVNLKFATVPFSWLQWYQFGSARYLRRPIVLVYVFVYEHHIGCWESSVIFGLVCRHFTDCLVFGVWCLVDS